MIDFNKVCFEIKKMTVGIYKWQMLQMISTITKTVQRLANWNQQSTKLLFNEVHICQQYIR